MRKKNAKSPEFIDQEEKDLIDDLETNWDQYRSVLTPKRKNELEAGAKATLSRLNKTERITLRLSHSDLAALKKRAELDGIPYQTLIGSILHRFNNGRLVDSLSKESKSSHKAS